MPRMHITTSFDVPDDSRAQARIMAALDDAATKLESAIAEHAKAKATVEMRVVRHKAASVAAVDAPVPISDQERASMVKRVLADAGE